MKCSIHAKALLDIIYKEKEVVKQLSHVSKNIHIIDNIDVRPIPRFGLKTSG